MQVRERWTSAEEERTSYSEMARDFLRRVDDHQDDDERLTVMSNCLERTAMVIPF